MTDAQIIVTAADERGAPREAAAALSAHHEEREGAHKGAALAIRDAGGDVEIARLHDQAADYHFDAARSYRIARNLYDRDMPASAESHMRSGEEWRTRAETWETRHGLLVSHFESAAVRRRPSP